MNLNPWIPLSGLSSIMRAVTFKADLFADPSDLQRSERALRHLLRAFVAINLDYLRTHPNTPLLYQAGVRYEREMGTEEWRGIPIVLKHKAGDCEDLASWRVAELIYHGMPAQIFLKKKKKGNFYLFHVMVQHADGRIEDPSRRLGMGRE